MVVELNKKIDEIYKQVIDGKISLLDLELVPIFNELRDSLTIHNIHEGSETYKEAYKLLNHKFEELKVLLTSMDNAKYFQKFLDYNPSDKEIFQLLNSCWIKTFNTNSLSFKFMEDCKNRLCQDRKQSLSIEHPDLIETEEEFQLEMPKYNFNEKMIKYLEKIRKKLPCKFNDVFEIEDQSKIYEEFVYILHLLQMDKIKYKINKDVLYIK